MSAGDYHHSSCYHSMHCSGACDSTNTRDALISKYADIPITDISAMKIIPI